MFPYYRRAIITIQNKFGASNTPPPSWGFPGKIFNKLQKCLFPLWYDFKLKGHIFPSQIPTLRLTKVVIIYAWATQSLRLTEVVTFAVTTVEVSISKLITHLQNIIQLESTSFLIIHSSSPSCSIVFFLVLSDTVSR